MVPGAEARGTDAVPRRRGSAKAGRPSVKPAGLLDAPRQPFVAELGAQLGEVGRRRRATRGRRRPPRSGRRAAASRGAGRARASSRPARRLSTRRAARAAGRPSSAGSSGMASRCPNLVSTAAADFAPQPGMPGKPSAESPTSASQSGIDAGGTPNLRGHAGVVEHDVPAAVPGDDAVADHGLRQVLVRRAEHDLVDAGQRRGSGPPPRPGRRRPRTPPSARPRCRAPAPPARRARTAPAGRGRRRRSSCSRRTARCGTTR